MSIKSKLAFTLIELLVVITVINLLSSIVMISAATARQKSRMVQRVSNLREFQKALELYNLRANAYPDSTPIGGGGFLSECTGGGFVGQPKNQWIPGLVSGEYIRNLPTDPFMNSGAGLSCYAYRSDSGGQNYKLILYQIQDIGGSLPESEYLTQSQLLDPRRDKNQSANCTVETTGPNTILAWAVYTRGACSF